MAIFRKIHITYWSDPFISELKADEKLFYIYLMTNPNTTQCGIYEITKKQISFDLGYTIDRVSVLLKYFIKCGKIRYNEQTFELAVKNWGKYNDSTSPKIKVLVNKELAKVKDKVLIEYLYSIDTHSQPEQEPEQEEESEPKEDIEKPKGIFPDDLEKVFNQFLEMRKKTKKPATEKAIELLRKKLKELSDNKQKRAIEILNQSIINNWQDLYQLKTPQTNAQSNNNQQSNRELSAEIDRKLIAKLTGENVDSQHIPSGNLLE